MTPPSILYKYLPPSRVDVLLRKRIRFSPPEDLNDPFESRPVVRADSTSTEEGSVSESDDKDLADRKARWWNDRAHRVGTEIVRNRVNGLFGVLSLSADPVQPVMWAHYADNFRGFLLGLDTGHEWFYGEEPGGEVTHGLYRVQYAIDRPTVFVGPDGVTYPDDLLDPTLLRKSKSWEFEQEWRCIELRARALDAGECEGVSDLFPFPEDLVREVVLGPHIEPETRAIISDTLSEGAFPRARLREIRMHTETFSLGGSSVPQNHDSWCRAWGFL